MTAGNEHDDYDHGMRPAEPGWLDKPREADDRLALDGERLPWLETADDDVDEGTVQTSRIVGFAVIGLLALAALLGGIWWAGNRTPDRSLVADGSLVPAPDGPYKIRPTDPGGKKFAGTGDSSFAVGEGQTREGRIADVPAVTAEVAASPTATSTSPPIGPPSPQVATIGVQVGAFSSRESAEAAWPKLMRQTEALSGIAHRVLEGKADIGPVFRLQAVTGSVSAANALCARLKGDGLACQVKR